MPYERNRVVRTGLPALDILLGGGLTPGVTTIASRSGIGKTILAYNITEFASRQGLTDATPAPTLLFHDESSYTGVMYYLVSSKTGIPRKKIKRGDLSPEQTDQVFASADEIKQKHRLYFMDDVIFDLSKLRRRVEHHVISNGLSLLVLDGPGSGDFRRFPDLMPSLAEIARDYNIAILTTYDLDSQHLDLRDNKKPQLSDLEKAFRVEQESEAVIFLYRDAYYNPDADPNAGEIIVAKSQHGETGVINAHFAPDVSQWREEE